MWILLVALFLAPSDSGANSAAEPLFQDATKASPPAARRLEPEFKALELKYGAALREYDEKRIRLVHSGDTDSQVVHPSRGVFPEFLALAEKGSEGAQGWVLENLSTAVSDPAERARVAKEIFPKLAGDRVDAQAALHAIEGLKKIVADLGEPTAMEMARTLEEKSDSDAVKSEAMMLQAWIHSQGGKTSDPERWKDTTEIYRSVLFLLPNTRAGKEAAGILIGPVQKGFVEAERKWVDTLRELQAAGKSPDEWPPQPIHEIAPQFQPIAAAGHHAAAQVVNKLYPAYEQAENQGKPFAYQWLVQELGVYYSDGVDGPWNSIRCDLVTVLYRQFPNEKWVFSSLRNIAPIAEFLPTDRLAPGFQALYDKSREPKVRALALYGLALCAKVGGDQQSYEKAIELFTRVREEFPDSEFRVSADASRIDLASAMPGQPAPSAPAPDTDGISFSVADYKGRVVMLEFWTFNAPACLEGVPLRAALLEELAAKPFSLVGVNYDGIKASEFVAKAGKAGIRWRNALVYYGHPVMSGWEARRQPTTVLIDKKGIIRGRDLPWPEMAALARKLVEEAE